MLGMVWEGTALVKCGQGVRKSGPGGGQPGQGRLRHLSGHGGDKNSHFVVGNTMTILSHFVAGAGMTGGHRALAAQGKLLYGTPSN